MVKHDAEVGYKSTSSEVITEKGNVDVVYLTPIKAYSSLQSKNAVCAFLVTCKL